MTISLTNKSDHIKGSWWEWDCKVEMEDGSIRDGQVQSDGHMIAEETLILE